VAGVPCLKKRHAHSRTDGAPVVPRSACLPESATVFESISVKLELNDITLCAIDSINRPLAARALQISTGHCKFADAILFSDEPVEGSFRNVRIDPLSSIAAYSAFMLKELVKRFDTPFVLVTQWDGYVIDPTAWSAEFLQYDYIGAKWPYYTDGMQVGNGGFSLRSKRLLEVLAGAEFSIMPQLAEDELICRIHRPVLERRHGIRFAPPALADRFSYELSLPQGPTFGFHGMINFWRHVPDADIAKIVDLLPPSAFQNEHCARLAATYFLHQRWIPLRALYRRWRQHFSFDDVRQQLTPAVPSEFLARCLQSCEKLL